MKAAKSAAEAVLLILSTFVGIEAAPGSCKVSAAEAIVAIVSTFFDVEAAPGSCKTGR